MNKTMGVTEALQEVADYCSDEAYTVLLNFIENLENDIEMLNIEIDSMERQTRRRHREEDWQ